MIGRVLDALRRYRKERHLARLVGRGLKIGRNVQIEGDCFFDPSHCFLISVGDGCVLAPGVRLIAHDASMFGFIGITKIGRIDIGEKCFLGDSVCVLPNVTIGAHSVVGACSVVVRDIPPRSVAVGNPARVVCALDEFLDKHRENSRNHRSFQESEYSIATITDAGKREMLEYLAGNRVAYMAGTTAAVTLLNWEP